MLSLLSVTSALTALFTSSTNEEDVVKSPLPHSLLRKYGFLAKLSPFLSDVVANDREKIQQDKEVN